MKAITLHQPWASLIAMGLKTIETRTHSRFAVLAGRRIAIHAGLHWDRRAWEAISPYLPAETLEGLRCRPAWAWPAGAIVATAQVIRCRRCLAGDSTAALIDCRLDEGLMPHGLFLAGITPIEPPIPAVGRQGIWEWTPQIEAEIERPDDSPLFSPDTTNPKGA